MTDSMDVVHGYTHAGKFFSGGHYSSSIANAATLMLLIQATGEFHALLSATATGDCTVQLFTGTTFSSAGTNVAMSNHKLSSAATCPATVTHTPTITLNGTQFNGTELLPGGTKHSGGGGQAGFGNEMILSAGNVCLLLVTNVSGGTIKMSLSVEGYGP
jgi:hypothetical protein